MSNSTFNNIIVSLLSDKLNYEELCGILDFDKEKIINYNEYILEILDQKFSQQFFTIKINKLKEIEVEKQDFNIIQDQVDLNNENKSEFLKYFYEKEMCPSFLYTGSLLNENDYSYLLEIYSKYYGFTFDKSQEDIIKLLKTTFDKYIFKIIDIANEIQDEDKIKILLRN